MSLLTFQLCKGTKAALAAQKTKKRSKCFFAKSFFAFLRLIAFELLLLNKTIRRQTSDVRVPNSAAIQQGYDLGCAEKQKIPPAGGKRRKEKERERREETFF
jgi:hypothetical protein